MSDATVNAIVHRLAARAGLKGRLTAHSLRAGLCTAAAFAGRRIDEIQRQSRHASVAVLLGYVRAAEDETNCAAAGLL
jgi:integrase